MLKHLVILAFSLSVWLADNPAPAAEPDPRASTRQLIVRLKDDGLRRIQAVRSDDTVPELSLSDGRPLSFVRQFNGSGGEIGGTRDMTPGSLRGRPLMGNQALAELERRLGCPLRPRKRGRRASPKNDVRQVKLV